MSESSKMLVLARQEPTGTEITVSEIDGLKFRAGLIKEAQERSKSRNIRLNVLNKEYTAVSEEIEEATKGWKQTLETEKAMISEQLAELKSKLEDETASKKQELTASVENEKARILAEMKGQKDDLRKELSVPYKIRRQDRDLFWNELKKFCDGPVTPETKMVRQFRNTMFASGMGNEIVKRFGSEADVESDAIKRFIWTDHLYPAIAEDSEKALGHVYKNQESPEFKRLTENHLLEICRYYIHSINFDWSRKNEFARGNYNFHENIKLGFKMTPKYCNRVIFRFKDILIGSGTAKFVDREIDKDNFVDIILDFDHLKSVLKSDTYDDFFKKKIFPRFKEMLIKLGIPFQDFTLSEYLKKMRYIIRNSFEIDQQSLAVSERLRDCSSLSSAIHEVNKEAGTYVLEMVEQLTTKVSPYESYFREKTNYTVNTVDIATVESLVASMLSELTGIPVKDEMAPVRKRYNEIQETMAGIESHPGITEMRKNIDRIQEENPNHEKILEAEKRMQSICQKMENPDLNPKTEQLRKRGKYIKDEISEVWKVINERHQMEWKGVNLEDFPALKEELHIFVIRKTFELRLMEALLPQKQSGRIEPLEERNRRRTLEMEKERFHKFMCNHGFKPATINDFYNNLLKLNHQIFRRFDRAPDKKGFFRISETKQDIIDGISVSEEATQYFRLKEFIYKLTLAGKTLLSSSDPQKKEAGDLYCEIAYLLHKRFEGVPKELETRLNVSDMNVFLGLDDALHALSGLFSNDGRREVLANLDSLDTALDAAAEAKSTSVSSKEYVKDWEKRLEESKVK